MEPARVEALSDLACLGPRCTVHAVEAVCAILDECARSDYHSPWYCDPKWKNPLELALSIVAASLDKQPATDWVLHRFGEDKSMAADPASSYYSTSDGGPVRDREITIAVATVVAYGDDVCAKSLLNWLLEELREHATSTGRQLAFIRDALTSICMANRCLMSALVSMRCADGGAH